MVESRRIFVPYALQCCRHVVFLFGYQIKFYQNEECFWECHGINVRKKMLTKVRISGHLLTFSISGINIDKTVPVVRWDFQQVQHYLVKKKSNAIQRVSKYEFIQFAEQNSRLSGSLFQRRFHADLDRRLNIPKRLAQRSSPNFPYSFWLPCNQRHCNNSMKMYYYLSYTLMK